MDIDKGLKMPSKLENLIDEAVKEYQELDIIEIEELILNYLDANPDLTPDDIELVSQQVISTNPFLDETLYWVRRKDGEEE